MLGAVGGELATVTVLLVIGVVTLAVVGAVGYLLVRGSLRPLQDHRGSIT